MVYKYQELVESTAVFPPEMGVLYPVLGLAGEVGEVVEKIKKAVRDGRISLKWGEQEGCSVQVNVNVEEIAKELGDCLWYIVAVGSTLGISLEQIMQINHDKLMSRKKRNVLIGKGDNR